MSAGQRNLEHAIADDCTDPDCEIHNPDCIEDDESRYTAKAFYLAGAHAMRRGAESWIDTLDDVHNLRKDWP